MITEPQHAKAHALADRIFYRFSSSTHTHQALFVQLCTWELVLGSFRSWAAQTSGWGPLAAPLFQAAAAKCAADYIHRVSEKLVAITEEGVALDKSAFDAQVLREVSLIEDFVADEMAEDLSLDAATFLYAAEIFTAAFRDCCARQIQPKEGNELENGTAVVLASIQHAQTLASESSLASTLIEQDVMSRVNMPGGEA